MQEYQWWWPFHPYIHICFGGRGHTTPSSTLAAGSGHVQQELLFKPTGSFSSPSPPSPVFHIPSFADPPKTPIGKRAIPGCTHVQSVTSVTVPWELNFPLWMEMFLIMALAQGHQNPRAMVEQSKNNIKISRCAGKSRRNSLALICRARWNHVSKENKPTQDWTFPIPHSHSCAVPKYGAKEGILLLMVMLQSSVKS